MDEFEEYWTLLPDRDNVIHDDLIFHLNVSNERASEPEALKQNTILFLGQCLRKHPYPTCQLLRLFPSISGDIFYKTLVYNVKRLDNEETKQKLFNLLINFDLPETLIPKVEQDVFPLLFKHIRDNEEDRSRLWFCLVASLNQPHNVLKSFLEYYKKCILNDVGKSSIFIRAIELKSHFLESIIIKKHSIDCLPSCLNDSLFIVKQIKNIYKPKFSSQKMLTQLNQIDLNRYTGSANRLFIIELRRLLYLQHSLNHHIPNIEIESLVASFNVIHYLWKNVDLALFEYATLKSILVENQRYNVEIRLLQQHNVDLNTDCTELELYAQFSIVKLILGIIILNYNTENYEEIISNRLMDAKKILRSIDTFSVYVNVIKTIFSLLFIRWEHIEHKSNSDDGDFDCSIESCTESEIDSTKILIKKYEKMGFICTQATVEGILNLLKMSVTQKKHSDKYTEADELHRTQFNQIYDNINDALWRLSLFRFIENNLKISAQLEFSKILTIHSKMIEKRPNTSTDEEHLVEEKPVGVANRRKSISSIGIRRKPKRKYFRKGDDERSVSFSHSTENEQKTSGDTMTRSSLNNEKRCIVDRMLGSAEHLAATCLRKGDLEATKVILKANSLENSQFAQELTFSENLNQTKQKLRDVFIKYKKEDMSQSTEMNSELERIKKAAAVGFEASKITNIMATFAQANPIKQDETIVNLFERFRMKYPFLNIYAEPIIQATIILDFVLSLANNYDICSNIFNMLTKTWSICEIYCSGDTHILGYFGFFRNLVECLRLYKSVLQESISVQQLMYNECYSLNPIELSKKLKQEKIFKRLLRIKETEIATMDDLYSISKQFDDLKLDTVNYFKRIYTFAENAQRLLQFSEIRQKKKLSEILEIDLYALIGEIIFEQSISPIEIESITTNMNINLVHCLAENLAPAIDLKRNNDMDADRRHFQAMIDSIDYESDGVSQELDSLNESDEFFKPKIFKMNQSKVATYLKKHNNLLAYLIKEIQNYEDDQIHCKSMFLENLSNLNGVKSLAILYEGNEMLSALNYDKIDVRKLHLYLSTTSDYRNTLFILQRIKDIDRHKYSKLINELTDFLILRFLEDRTFEPFEINLIEKISNINTKAKCLLDNILEINSSDQAKGMIQNILIDKETLKHSYRKDLQKWLQNIDIYDHISNVINNGTWSKIMEINIDSPEKILQCLMEQCRYELCIEWIGIHPLQTNSRKIVEFLDIFSTILLNETNLNRNLFKIIESLPKETVLQFYSNLLDAVKNLEILAYMIDFLTKYSISSYQKYEVSLRIFQQLRPDDHDSLWNLIGAPLLIVEQYLMNSKFEILSLILEAIKPALADGKCRLCHMKLESVFEDKFDGCDNRDYLDKLSRNHCITQQCIDSLLRVYATKALDFRITETNSLSHQCSQSSELASLDSLCGAFVMPKQAPAREEWIRDEDATHCMCCRRARFSMLTRRHHCRRCGRVVCHACSTKRMPVPNLYADILVRVCNDCFKQTETLKAKLQKQTDSPPQQRSDSPYFRRSSDTLPEWRFTGIAKHDTLLRDEFSYEYAPSVSLCLSILTFHSSTKDYSNFLLYHCRILETLLRPIHPGYPNPEIDYALVTRMLNCLALAAKVRGNLPECDVVRDHTEIIRSVVKNGCESLLPMEPPNTSSFRKLRDSLVIAERWSLALEVSLKCGFSTTGVMAAWGISSLKAGCFETAREKFCHCMPRALSDNQQYKILALVSSDSSVDLSSIDDFPQIHRPQKSSPLLSEIMTILETSCRPSQADVLARANLIRDSNTSLSSKKSRKKENIPLHEPALNVLHSLSNLRQISQGVYSNTKDNGPLINTIEHRKLLPKSRFYDESLYYLINFGSHISIIQFLIKQDQLFTALKYLIFQNVEPDVFVHAIFMPYLKQGKAETIITVMMVLDESLTMWQKYIIHTCRYLERNGLLNSLYHIQILLNDPIRASMTCVRFYSMNCSTFRDLQSNSFHLMNAQKHLQSELELCQWEEIKLKSSKKPIQMDKPIIMKMDSKTLNSHINTIWRQIEVTKFLAKCEAEGRETVSLIPKICSTSDPKIPTLFGSMQEKIQLVILTLICGTNIIEGFGLSFRIIQDFNLSTSKAFGGTAKYLASNNRLNSVEKLIDCIKSNNGCDPSFYDEIILLAVQTAVASSTITLHSNVELKGHLTNLIKLITDVGTKISCHILASQLKSAYLLAVQHNRLNDVKRVWRQAEQTNQNHIKKLCEKKLNISKN